MTQPTLTTYGGALLEVGYAGQLTHELGFADIDSKTNESATAIDFGIAVARGLTGDETCKPVGTDADQILGISVRYPIRPADAAGNVLFRQYDSVPILRSGYIFAIAFENVTRGTGVLSVTAQAGKLSGVSAGAAGAGRVAIPGATWETTTLAGAIGKIRLA